MRPERKRELALRVRKQLTDEQYFALIYDFFMLPQHQKFREDYEEYVIQDLMERVEDVH